MATKANSARRSGGKVEIEVSLNQFDDNDKVIAALAKRGDIYDRNGELVEIIHRDGRATAKSMCKYRLAEVISATCGFCQVKSVDPDTGQKHRKPVPVPRQTSETIRSRGHWPDMRPLRGIVTSPVLRSDGSILQTSGYDVDSGLYVDLTETFPTIAAAPSKADVQHAVDTLFDVVSDFPFADAASKSAWLASLLTPLARDAYQGCTGPIFLFDGNIRACGKSLLTDINSLIVTGRDSPRMTADLRDDEARKRITALVMDFDRIALLDNISSSFGCASMDVALTGTVWRDRRLGQTEMIEAPLRMTWYATGNNVVLSTRSDVQRRVCRIRLESPLEHPEDKKHFRHPKILQYVRDHRPELLAAALTILRGYFAAGRPDMPVIPSGSFEGWTNLVCSAIVWCELADPGETKKDLRATTSSEDTVVRQVFAAIAALGNSPKGFRAAELVDIATGKTNGYDAERTTLADALCELCDCDSVESVNGRTVGSRLGNLRDRTASGMKLTRGTHNGHTYWRVSGSSGCSGPTFNTITAIDSEDISQDSEKRSTTSTTSTC
jgi:hypothetical protein